MADDPTPDRLAPAGYSTRAPRTDDADAIGALLAADDRNDDEPALFDAAFVRDGWSEPGFELATDAWAVVQGDGSIVGYAQATEESPGLFESWGTVDPTHRGRGIGSALLDRIERRVPRPTRLHHSIKTRDAAAAALLEARGLKPVRHFCHMRIDPTAGRPARPGPAGIAIAPMRPPGDLRAVHAVLDEAFADHWEHHSEPFERWAGRRTASPSYDPGLWLLARAGEQLAGALTASVLDDHGWVDELGVRAAYRRRGIAAALLEHAFAAFAARGMRSVLLNVDSANSTGATELYERVGMRAVSRWDVWERA